MSIENIKVGSRGTSVTLVGYLQDLHGPEGVCTDGCYGRTTKATVLAAVNAAATDDDKARIDAAILRVAARGGEFSANDVRPLLDGLTGGIVGARFNALARAGRIVRVGYVASTKGNTHSHPVATWRTAA